MSNLFSVTNFLIFDPLDQFETMKQDVLTGFFQGFALNTTNIFYINIFIFIGVCLLNEVIKKELHYVEKSSLGQLYYRNFLTSLTWNWIVDANMIEEESMTYYLIATYIFLLIILSNVIGLIPYSYTNTSSLIYTLFISLSLFLGICILGITQQRYQLFNFFLPEGSPFILTPLIAFVELFSFVSRVFSLAIRLFANMMAGHTLLKILIGFSWVMLGASGLKILFAAIPWIVVTLIMGLESVIAGLQAYVFVTLFSIYINDMFNLH